MSVQANRNLKSNPAAPAADAPSAGPAGPTDVPPANEVAPPPKNRLNRRRIVIASVVIVASALLAGGAWLFLDRASRHNAPLHGEGETAHHDPASHNVEHHDSEHHDAAFEPESEEGDLPGPDPSDPDLVLAHAASLAEEHPEKALRWLERGLAALPAEKSAIRARFFAHLSAVARRTGKTSAAGLYNENALRLARESDGPELFLDLAESARAALDLDHERRHLSRWLLQRGGAQGSSDSARVLSRLASSIEAQWARAANGTDPERIPEPSLLFEDRR